MNDTLCALRQQLHANLNDLDRGNYPDIDNELDMCINMAKRATEIRTKCHITTIENWVPGAVGKIVHHGVPGGTGYSVGEVLYLDRERPPEGRSASIKVLKVGADGAVTSVKLLEKGEHYVAGTSCPAIVSDTEGSGCMIHVLSVEPTMTDGVAVYDTDPIFEPIEVSLHWLDYSDQQPGHESILEKRSLKDFQARVNYNYSAIDKPRMWYPLSGSKIQLYPTPDRNAGADYYFRIHGYAVSPDLLDEYDRPESIPAGYREVALLAYAEAMARKMRMTTIPNHALYTALMEDWKYYCDQIVASLKGVGK